MFVVQDVNLIIQNFNYFDIYRVQLIFAPHWLNEYHNSFIHLNIYQIRRSTTFQTTFISIRISPLIARRCVTVVFFSSLWSMVPSCWGSLRFLKVFICRMCLRGCSRKSIFGLIIPSFVFNPSWIRISPIVCAVQNLIVSSFLAYLPLSCLTYVFIVMFVPKLVFMTYIYIFVFTIIIPLIS